MKVIDSFEVKTIGENDWRSLCPVCHADSSWVGGGDYRYKGIDSMAGTKYKCSNCGCCFILWYTLQPEFIERVEQQGFTLGNDEVVKPDRE